MKRCDACEHDYVWEMFHLHVMDLLAAKDPDQSARADFAAWAESEDAEQPGR